MVLDVDFGFFYFEIFSLVTQDLVTSSPEGCLCVKDNPHPFVRLKCVSDFLPHFLGLTWGALKTLCGQILPRVGGGSSSFCIGGKSDHGTVRI